MQTFMIVVFFSHDSHFDRRRERTSSVQDRPCRLLLWLQSDFGRRQAARSQQFPREEDQEETRLHFPRSRGGWLTVVLQYPKFC